MELTNFLTDDERLEQDGLVAAIDVGSNAMRLGIAAHDEKGVPQLIQRYREPVRLGHDAFTSESFSTQTMDDAVHAFHQFKRILQQYHIENYRAVATSAMRDSRNGQQLIDKIKQETDISLELISGEEEARLVHYSIARRVDLLHQFVLLVDMGGGSVEVTLCDNGEVISAQSFKLGTVRLLELLGKSGNFNTLLSEYMESVRNKLKEQIGTRQASLCIATGGNAGALGSLIYQYFDGESATSITRKQLFQLIHHLENLSLEERMDRLQLRPDRADVILPAAIVFHEIMLLANIECMIMPEASLLDGVLLDMMDTETDTQHSRRNNLLAMAQNMGKRFHIDRHYGKIVAHLALNIFDQSYELHHVHHQDRLLLEIAAHIHEIGMYVRVGGHHRHAAYLISASSLLGLSDQDKAVLAQVVRYQRKVFPNESHRDFSQLSDQNQQRVKYLSVFLRLGIALNKDRRHRIHHIHVELSEKYLKLHLQGKGDLLLERWSSMKVGDYVQAIFGLDLHIVIQV
ncbi:MAG: Ppx/GppA phosphatase family protein [Mariprofundaceae bacterium]|nr:Ppx/GppA phosphatase family protein [Mariprofundaceae bacterium]